MHLRRIIKLQEQQQVIPYKANGTSIVFGRLQHTSIDLKEYYVQVTRWRKILGKCIQLVS